MFYSVGFTQNLVYLERHLNGSVPTLMETAYGAGGAGGAAAPPVGKKIVLLGQSHSKKYFII